MRTTIRLDDALLRRAKALAATTGRSLNDFIEDAIRASLAPRAAGAGPPVELPTFKGRGMQPGVDLDDSSALLDLVEDRGELAYAHRPPVTRAARVAERPKNRARSVSDPR